MAEPHTPPQNTTYTTSTPNPPYGTNTTTTTHIREPAPSTNWFAYLLGGAVIAVGVGALVLSGDDDVAPATGGNNVTIEAPAATAPAADPVTPAPADPVTPAPADPVTPAPADPVAPAPADPVTPAPADPVAPAPEAVTPAPAGN